MDLGSPWFDPKAFEDCAAEQGVPISLAKKEVIAPGNPEYDVEPQIGFKSRPLKGHIARKSSIISTGAGPVMTEQIFAYILPSNFSTKEVVTDSYLLVGNVYYQMELVDTIYSRGEILQYKYKLDKTDGTVFK